MRFARDDTYGAMPTEGVLGALRVLRVLGGLLFPGWRDDAWLCALRVLGGEITLGAESPGLLPALAPIGEAPRNSPMNQENA